MALGSASQPVLFSQPQRGESSFSHQYFLQAMKKVSLALLLACLPLATVWAQNSEVETVSLKHVKKGEEPQQVMTALNKDFPQPVVQDVSKMSALAYGQQWSLNENDASSDDCNAVYYEVNAKRKNMSYTAVHDKNGKLDSYREIIQQTALPMPLLRTLSTQHAAW